MARPNLKNCTKAVRDYIETLEKNLAGAQKRVDDVAGLGPVGKASNTCVDVLEGGAMLMKALPNDQTIVFVLREGRQVRAQVQMESLTGIPRLVLWATNRYGSGMLGVAPCAANKVEVFVDPKDEYENWSPEAKKRAEG